MKTALNLSLQLYTRKALMFGTIQSIIKFQEINCSNSLAGPNSVTSA